MSSCIKQVWLVMLINFCLLHLRCLGSLCWLSATVSSERATSSLSGAGGNFLHTSNWTKCLSNSEPSYTDQIIIQTRCQQRFFTSLFLFCSLRRLLVDFMILPGLFKLPTAQWPPARSGSSQELITRNCACYFDFKAFIICCQETFFFLQCKVLKQI